MLVVILIIKVGLEVFIIIVELPRFHYNQKRMLPWQSVCHNICAPLLMFGHKGEAL